MNKLVVTCKSSWASVFGRLALVLLLGACTPTACNEEEQVIHREVEVLTGEVGSAAQEAKRRLVKRGRDSIVILETGLYQADAIGRVRIVDTLKQLQRPEARPILEHLIARDTDPLVRERAQDALAALEREP